MRIRGTLGDYAISESESHSAFRRAETAGRPEPSDTEWTPAAAAQRSIYGIGSGVKTTAYPLYESAV